MLTIRILRRIFFFLHQQLGAVLVRELFVDIDVYSGGDGRRPAEYLGTGDITFPEADCAHKAERHRAVANECHPVEEGVYVVPDRSSDETRCLGKHPPRPIDICLVFTSTRLDDGDQSHRRRERAKRETEYEAGGLYDRDSRSAAANRLNAPGSGKLLC